MNDQAEPKDTQEPQENPAPDLASILAQIRDERDALKAEIDGLKKQVSDRDKAINTLLNGGNSGRSADPQADFKKSVRL